MKLLLVDFKARVVGIESASLNSGISHLVRIGRDWTRGNFVEVISEGCVTASLIGLMAVAEAIFRRDIFESDIGKTIRFGKEEYLIRPCRVDLMSIRLSQRYQVVFSGCREKQLLARSAWAPSFTEARRRCFGARKNQMPERVWFGKGTVSVPVPEKAVARVGSSESSTLVFLDKFANPIEAYEKAGRWDDWWAKPIEIPKCLSWRNFSILGQSVADALSGVSG